MKKLRRWLIYTLIVLLAAPVISVAAFDILRLQPRLDQINTLVANGESLTQPPTPLIKEMISIAEPNNLYWLVSRIIVTQSQPKFDSSSALKRHTVELLTTHLLELHISESEIITIYSARVFAGDSSYGLSSVSERLFGKSLSDLTAKEAATVAAWPKAPSYFAKNPSRLELRRDVILKKFGGGI